MYFCNSFFFCVSSRLPSVNFHIWIVNVLQVECKKLCAVDRTKEKKNKKTNKFQRSKFDESRRNWFGEKSESFQRIGLIGINVI